MKNIIKLLSLTIITGLIFVAQISSAATTATKDGENMMNVQVGMVNTDTLVTKLTCENVESNFEACNDNCVVDYNDCIEPLLPFGNLSQCDDIKRTCLDECYCSHYQDKPKCDIELKAGSEYYAWAYPDGFCDADDVVIQR